MQDIKSKKGFTIIEVVLVLAIAGLIFLMVFIALPAMQRSQRDTQRRNDYSQLSAAMTSYMTSNNGSLPAAGKLDPSKYINDSGTDPSGFVYALNVIKCTSTSCADTKVKNGTTDSADTAYGTKTTTKGESHYVTVFTNAKCVDGQPAYAKSARAFAVYGYLESGNGTYCNSSS